MKFLLLFFSQRFEFLHEQPHKVTHGAVQFRCSRQVHTFIERSSGFSDGLQHSPRNPTQLFDLNFIIFLIFWQDIKEIFMKPQLLFVDKLSIPQDDEKLKQDYITGLGGYLRSSRKLVILWSEGQVKGGNPEPISPRPQDSDIKMIQAT